MNKKISTLFAAAMLASAFTVNAGVYVGDAVSKLAIGNNEKLYQLQLNSVGSTTETAERVLALDEDGKILIENAQTVTLGTSLWCVNVQKQNQGQYLQPIITQYFIDNKSEIWLLFLIAHSKR